MTDQSHRPDGDGLPVGEDTPYWRTLRAALVLHVEEQYAIAKDLAANCGYELTGDSYTASPKPAPDAMRTRGSKAWQSSIADALDFLEASATIKGNAFNVPEIVSHNAKVEKFADLIRPYVFAACPDDETRALEVLLRDDRKQTPSLSAPVKPADGADIEGEIIKLMDASWPEGHREMARKILSRFALIPSGARAAEPVAWGRAHVEYSASRGQSRVEYWVSREDGKIIAAELATPPARGDREILKRIAEFCSGDHSTLGAIARLAEIQRIANDAVQSTARPDREAFYTILKKYVPQDASFDALLQELLEAAGVQSGAGEREVFVPLDVYVDLLKAVTDEVNEKGAGGYLLARLSDARKYVP